MSNPIDWEMWNKIAVDGAIDEIRKIAIGRFGGVPDRFVSPDRRDTCPNCHARIPDANKWVVMSRVSVGENDDDDYCDDGDWVYRVRGGYCWKCRTGICLVPEKTPAWLLGLDDGPMEEEDE